MMPWLLTISNHCCISFSFIFYFMFVYFNSPVASLLMAVIDLCLCHRSSCFNLFYAKLISNVLNFFNFRYPFSCFFRRTMCNKILQIIKDEGAFSTMHSFLIYLQMAPKDQQPLVASLLLQLDLLVCLIFSLLLLFDKYCFKPLLFVWKSFNIYLSL